MKRIIKSIENAYLLPALEQVEDVFSKHENAEEGKLVRSSSFKRNIKVDFKV